MKANDKRSMPQDQALKALLEKDAKINELQLANKVLTAKVEQYKNIFAYMPGSVYWKDLDKKYLGCNYNVAKILKLPSIDYIVGKNNDDILTNLPELATSIKQLDQLDDEIIATGKESCIEETGLDQLGKPLIYLSQKIPFYDNDGKIAGILGVSLDITDRKRTEEELKTAKEQAEKASLQKSEFIANMSHDIKTPLAGIFSISELLTYHLQGENLHFIQILLASSKQLIHFFDSCLELFKLENSSAVPTSTAFDLRNLLNELSELFQPTCLSKDLTFNVCFGAKISFYVIGNRPSIYRILLNLIGNAVKFTNSGSITVFCHLKQAKNHPTQLVFVVEDSGIGIPADKLNIIFERFMRLTPSYKGIYDGSGIGLYLVQKSVAAMGGNIRVESQEGKGSKFTIELPIQIPSYIELDNSKELTSALDKQQAALGNKDARAHILLVEDNLIVQRIQTALLTSLNCGIEIAETGEKAVEMFKPGKYDLIFMDIGLPGIQGDLAAAQIREQESDTAQQTPIIALTAHATSDVNNKCLEAGINKVMNKPLSLEDTKDVLQQFCGVEVV